MFVYRKIDNFEPTFYFVMTNEIAPPNSKQFMKAFIGRDSTTHIFYYLYEYLDDMILGHTRLVTCVEELDYSIKQMLHLMESASYLPKSTSNLAVSILFVMLSEL